MYEEKAYYTETELTLLRSNPNVLKVTKKLITFSPSFKVAAVEAYLNHQRPTDIFRNAGFNIELIGRETPKRSLLRWRKVYAKYGMEGLLVERRGQNRKGVSTIDHSSPIEKLKRAEARIKFLEAENELLKKLEALERQHHNHNKLTSSECFKLINLVVRKYELKRVTRYLCQIASVSTSGYYRWCKAEEARQLRALREYEDYLLIQQHFNSLNGKAGALVIKMRLERLNGIIMNHKKIRRIMKKYHLMTTIRKANPYRRIKRATQEHKACSNHLQRQFNQGEPGKVLLTDITYLRYGTGQWAYLSCVKDGATKQILAHYISTTLELSLVRVTLKNLLEQLGGNIHPQAILHSDQGMHYTHPKIRLLIKNAGFRQSMSRKGNCWDNASMESFFGHMKDEIDIKSCSSIQELRICINEYISYYNSERYQWTLKKMTPDEYRSHLIAS